MIDRRSFLKQALAAQAFLAAPSLKNMGRKPAALKFSVCVDMILVEIPFLERLDRIKRLGYTAFEFWSWKNKDVEAITRKKNDLGLEVATIMGSGWKHMNTEEARKAFVAEIRESIEAARRLGSRTMIVTTGLEDKRIPRPDQHAAYVAALKAAAPYAEQAQVTLVLEPLNTTVDHPFYFLNSVREGLEIVDEVASPAVKLLFDIYHHQIMSGDIIKVITTNIAKIAHFHVADVPGRHEPGTGEINYANVFRAIRESGYQGYVGLEYKPSRAAEDTLREVLKMA